MGFLSFSFHLTKSCLKILVTIWSVMLSEVSGSSNVCAWVSFSSEILVACLAFLSLVFLSVGRRGTAERAPYMKERLGDLLNMTLACSPDDTQPFNQQPTGETYQASATSSCPAHCWRWTSPFSASSRTPRA